MVDLPSVVPAGYRDKDPRTLLYFYPSMPKVLYAKKMATFAFYYALDAAEQVAHRLGYVLVPYECLHWARRKTFAAQGRKIKIGRRTYYLMRQNEFTKNEKRKFDLYLSEHA